MVTRRVKTGGAYVGAGGLGAPSPPQWQNTYEDQEFTGEYVTDPGGGPDQWQWGVVSGGGASPYTFVQFGSGYSLDRLAASGSAGFLPTAESFRAIVRFKITEAVGSFPAGLTNEVIAHIATTTTNYFRLQRNKITGKLQFCIGASTLTSLAAPTTVPAIGDEVVCLVSYDGGTNWWEDAGVTGTEGKAMMSVYVNGTFAENIVMGVALSETSGLENATEFSIGAAVSGFASAANLYCVSQIADFRVWADDAADAIMIRASHSTYCTKTGTTDNAGQKVLTGIATDYSRLTVGTELEISGTEGGITPFNFNAVVATFDEELQTIVCVDNLEYDVEDNINIAIGWTTPDDEHIAAALSNTVPSSGALAGLEPLVYFGGTQTASDWNAGDNQGTLLSFSPISGGVE